MKLKIFGQQVKVMKAKGLGEQMGWAGCYDKQTNSIWIDSELVGDEYRETLIHEFLEAVFCRGSFTQSIEPQAKEIIIDMIAKAFNENFKVIPK